MLKNKNSSFTSDTKNEEYNLVYGNIKNYPWEKLCSGIGSMNGIPVNNYFFVIDEHMLDYSFDDLTGKLLTLIEASITDKTQLEAIKSFIRNIVYDTKGQLYGAYVLKDKFKI